MKIRLIFKQVAISTIIALRSKQISTTISIRIDKVNLITITRQITIIKRCVKINFLFSIFIKIVFIRYNNNNDNNNVLIKKTTQIESFIKHQLIAINYSKTNIYFIDRCCNSSLLSKHRYKIKTH